MSAVTAFAGCNLHLAIYCAFGLILMLRAAICRSLRAHDETREQFLHGLVYLLLGLVGEIR